MCALQKALLSVAGCRRSVPLVEVVHLFRSVFKSGEAREHQGLEIQSLEGLTAFAIGQLREQVEQALKEKIFVTYVAHEKLGQKQAKAIYVACSDLFGDWCSGDGTTCALFEYLGLYLNLDEQTYKDGLRVKMEYLQKIARQEFATALMRDL
jgi:hypothetical protein